MILHEVVKLRKWPNPKGKIPVSIHLIQKPAGGDRPIGITPLLAALLIRCLFPLVDEWDEERMNFWEDAVKGSSALKAGLFRRLLDECAVLIGKETVSIFWDLEKFYDSIDWVKVIRWSLELGFPARVLEIVMSVHMGPRVIKVGRICSEVLTPSNSLIAGCTSAIWLSRVMICTILERTHRVSPLRSRNFFDDIVIRATGGERNKLI